MTTIDDGGPAFARPIGEYKEMGSGAWSEQQRGMSLRDYAAIHSTQPGCSEIVAMAGLKWSASRVWLSENTGISFDQWWETMPLAKRLDLCAKVRYAQADAMLRARKEGK